MKKSTLLIFMLSVLSSVVSGHLFANSTANVAEVVQVATLAELRQQAADNTTIYEVTGEVVLTHKHGTRNQKYFQDATAAMLIDDNGGVITTNYNLNDGIKGLTGTLTAYRELLQFVPTADPGAATSENNVVEPLLLTLAQITPAHQAMLIRVNQVDFTGVASTFAASTNFSISDGTTDAVIFRTPSASSGLDYFGSPIPDGANDILLLVGQFDATMQVFARSLADFYPDGLPSYDVTFVVIDENGSAITDAIVTFDDVVGAAGAYTIADVEAGSYSYKVEKTGFYSRTGIVSITDDLTINIVLVTSDSNAVAEFPYVESFEGESFPPQYWKNISLGAGAWASSTSASEGSKAVWHNFTSGGEANSWLISPQIKIGADDNLLMKFFQKNSFMNDYKVSKVMISTGSGNPEHNEFVQVYEASASFATYTERIIGLGDYAGQTIYIAFVYSGQGGHQWYIDNVVIEAAPEAIILNNLAELRDVEAGGDLVYMISGEVFITHMHPQRNQKYVQDATAAVVIDDPNLSGETSGNIKTTYSLYDGITGLKGKLSSYNGLLQITPVEDPGAPTSSNNVVTPLLIKMDEMTINHQSMLLAIADVQINTTNTTFAPSTNYDVTDGTATLVMRPPSQSSALDYFGTDIPTSPVNMVVIGSIFGETLQFFPRSLADIGVQLSTNFARNDNVSIYPNPFSNYIRIDGLENLSQILVMNGLGQTVEVMDHPSQSVNINTAAYKQGIYIIRFIHTDGGQWNHKMIKK